MRSNSYYKKGLRSLITAAFIAVASMSKAQITLVQDYENTVSPTIGTFQGIQFKEAGFSGLYAIPGTNGKEFWTVSDRGVNVDAANANPSTCRPTYDKIYGFPTYAPKIHRIRLNGSSVEILQTITMKRPNGTNASGIINPTGFGSTALEVASTDTVLNCANFSLKVAPKDEWGIDSEGIVVDADGNFWICEEGGPTIWKLNPNGVVLQRYTPYANQPGSLIQDIQIDSVFEFRKNNRGFEGIALTPNGKIYAFIQSPLLYPTTAVGENSRIHRILEIDPATNQTQMFVYLNDGIIGASGANQIRLRDWKLGDAHAINNTEFLVLEAAARGTSDIKKLYKIDISNATPVTGGLYGGLTLEALVDAAGLTANGIVPVQKTLVMDLLANGWDATLDKAEGLAIIDANTIAICNDNDFGQASPAQNGIATATGKNSHVVIYSLNGANALSNYVPAASGLNQGITGISTLTTPYLQPLIDDAQFTSILTVGDQVGGYKMVGIPDGAGAFDNNDGTFTMLLNHELGNTVGVTRAHGSIGAFISKWTINKSDLSVVSGSDLIQTTYLWNSTTSAYEQQTAIFNRFCSADLAPVSAFYNSATGNGSQERIFLNGEESGAEARAFAHIASGANTGVTFQLPRMGRYSFENALASPVASDKTIVIGTDDTTPGEVYVYVGTKTNTGNEIERAGLTNGSLYGVAVTGLAAEVSTSIPTAGTTFTLASLGNVENMTGAALQTASTTASVTKFLRPEDGAWDPTSPNDFYFATTNSFTAPSRLWKLHFTDINNPELGGTITAVLDGTEGPKMIDNMAIDENGIALLQEDVGNNVHLGKIWQYNTNNDELKLVAQHDPARFIAGAPNFLTQDEESSGIIDVQDILGAGKFLLVCQAHYSIGGELVEGGQILSFYNPDSRDAYCATYATYTEFACDSYTWYGVTYTESGTYTHLSTNEEGCVFTETLNLTINTTSASAPAAVYGDGYACDYIAEGTTTTYSVDEVAGETYTWTAPNGMTILSGQGTSEILVSFSSAFSTSNLKVKATNSCGTSGFKLFKIKKLAPVLNTLITGINHVCSGDVVTYTVGSVAGASTYTWTAPVGSTIFDGQGTNVVTVVFNEGFVSSSSISVVASNGCGNSVTKTKPVFKNIIAKPSAIAGAKYGNCQNTGVYSVTNVAGITYNWTVIVGDMDIIDGLGTNEVLVDFGSNFSSGVILVTATNGCGTSVPRSIVLYANPAEITAINGASTVASGSTQSYSVAQVAGATSYTWYVPSGAYIVSGQGTASISVLFGNSSGDILVMASNACGNSFIKSKSVTVQSAPSAIIANNEVEMNSTFTVSPNPSNGEFILSGDIAANAEISIEVLDVTGRVVYSNGSMNVDSYLNVSISLSEIPNGMYFVNVKNNGQLIESIRMVKQ